MLLCLQLPGLISLSSKLVPTIMNMIKRLADEGASAAANDPHRNPPLASKNFTNEGNASSEMSSSASSGLTESDYSSPSKQD